MVRKRGMDSDNQGPLMAAALTMNIGMLSLQEVLYQQEKDLTSEQKQLIDSHPAQSVVMLHEAIVTDRLWLKCVLAHHEKIDGTAYPNQLSGEQYYEETQLITLADQYCARLSPRAYRQPLLHQASYVIFCSIRATRFHKR
jgi:HD-GYP domain-containing protein (c-di-GMP phosphodiesterase class II)